MKTEVSTQKDIYEVRLAHEDEGKVLAQFIDQHWKKDHVLVTCKDLLDWQYLDRMSGRYNFVIGIERQSQEIHGVLGFIPLSQFDSKIELERLCWMSIWKIQDAARGHKLGRRLLSYLIGILKPDILSTVGASEMTLPIYRAMGFKTGRLSHYFILHPEKSDFCLVSIKNFDQPRNYVESHHANKSLEKASENDIRNSTAECFHAQKNLPRKSPDYLINRYFRHPFYRYQTYMIRDMMRTTGVIVSRVCRHGKERAIRIVDFIGSSTALKGLRNQWMSLLRKNDAEYIDFYNTGIDENDLLSSGFTRRRAGDGIIIPHYFEPFSMENIEIDYMINVPERQTYQIVKGDSDQDRPNLMEGMQS